MVAKTLSPLITWIQHWAQNLSVFCVLHFRKCQDTPGILRDFFSQASHSFQCIKYEKSAHSPCAGLPIHENSKQTLSEVFYYLYTSKLYSQSFSIPLRWFTTLHVGLLCLVRAHYANCSSTFTYSQKHSALGKTLFHFKFRHSMCQVSLRSSSSTPHRTANMEKILLGGWI